MKTRKRILMTIALALITLVSVATLPAVSAKAQRKKEVRVYLWRDSASTSANPLGVTPVKRMVDATQPARGALEALLDGPSTAEQSKGYSSLSVEELSIGRLSIKGGTASVNFVASRTWAGWPGDLAPGRFREAVTRTLKQFPTVKRVIVSVNGDKKFDSGEG
jgi:spore germination protein GerM